MAEREAGSVRESAPDADRWIPGSSGVGSDAGGKRAANIYTLIATARLNDIDPYWYLRHALERIAEHPINRIDELLPWTIAAKLDDARRQAA